MNPITRTTHSLGWLAVIFALSAGPLPAQDIAPARQRDPGMKLSRLDPSPGSGGTMILEAPFRQVAPGETFMIPVWLIGGVGLTDMNVDLGYNPEVIQTGGDVIRGNLLEGADFEANPSEAGIVKIGFVPVDGGVSAPRGTIVQIPFRAVGEPGSTTELKINPRKFSTAGGGQGLVGAINGAVLIVDPTPRGPLHPVTGVGGKGPGDGGTKGGGTLPPVPTRRWTPKDAWDALKMSVDLIATNMAADIDRDASVTSTDARLIREAARQNRGR